MDGSEVASVSAARLFRVIVPVPDVRAGVQFYSAVLGVPGERVSPGRHYYDCGGTILAVVSEGHHLPGTFRPNPDQIYLSVPDLEAALERVKAAGPGRLDVPDQEPGVAWRAWGERSFYAEDPFGNPLCFVEAGTEFTSLVRP